MVKKSKTAGKTATSSTTTVVNYGTTKQKVDYTPAGVAVHTKDRKNIIVYLKNGEKLIISKPVSDKQLNYFKETTAEGYVDHNDTNRIYMYSEYVVKHIKETDYNEDLQSEKAPKKESNVEQQSKAMRETAKKAAGKTNWTINKALKDQEKEEQEAAEEAASKTSKKGGND